MDSVTDFFRELKLKLTTVSKLGGRVIMIHKCHSAIKLLNTRYMLHAITITALFTQSQLPPTETASRGCSAVFHSWLMEMYLLHQVNP